MKRKWLCEIFEKFQGLQQHYVQWVCNLSYDGKCNSNIISPIVRELKTHAGKGAQNVLPNVCPLNDTSRSIKKSTSEGILCVHFENNVSSCTDIHTSRPNVILNTKSCRALNTFVMVSYKIRKPFMWYRVRWTICTRYYSVMYIRVLLFAKIKDFVYHNHYLYIQRKSKQKKLSISSQKKRHTLLVLDNSSLLYFHHKMFAIEHLLWLFFTS